MFLLTLLLVQMPLSDIQNEQKNMVGMKEGFFSDKKRDTEGLRRRLENRKQLGDEQRAELDSQIDDYQKRVDAMKEEKQRLSNEKARPMADTFKSSVFTHEDKVQEILKKYDAENPELVKMRNQFRNRGTGN